MATIEVDSVLPGNGFSLHIKFYTDDIDDVTEWCSNTFFENFVILEFAHRIISGGAADNRLSWQEGWNKNSEYDSDHEYELRCSDKEAVLFLLKFKEN